MNRRSTAGRRLALLGLLLLGPMACDDTEATPDAAPGGDMAVGSDAATPGELAAILAGIPDEVDITRYSDDLEFVARGPRVSPEDPQWQAAQDRCAEVFLEAGLEVVRQPFPGGGVNVIGRLPGLERPAEQILIGAHYDSHWACNGADDNASGVAGVFEAARVLSGHRFARTLVFACFDVEEVNLQGSTDYARRAQAQGDDIRGVLVFEMIGYRDETPNSQRVPELLRLAFPDLAAQIDARMNAGDFLLYASDEDSALLEHLQAAAETLELPLIGVQLDANLRAGITAFRRSDHAPFWDAGYPGIMLTDTAEYRNPRYHCTLGEDDIGAIDMDFAVQVTAAGVGAVAAAAELVEGPPPQGAEVDPAPAFEPPARACDPVAQDCPDGGRCALLASGDTYPVACVAPTAEPLGLDDPCVRDADGGDLCDVGLFCTLTGRAVGAERRCRPLCLSDADCPADQACPFIRGEASNCVPRCDPFAPQCPEGTVCDPAPDNSRLRYALICGQAGELDEGAPCDQGFCRPGLVCSSELLIDPAVGCRRWCRLSAPECPEGQGCRRTSRRGLPDDLGVCLPADLIVD